MEHKRKGLDETRSIPCNDTNFYLVNWHWDIGFSQHIYSYKLTASKKLMENLLQNWERIHFQKIANELKCNLQKVLQALKQIQELVPKPGLIFQKVDRTSYITADVFVQKENDKWVTSLNEENSIKLKLIENAQNIIKTFDSELKEKFPNISAELSFETPNYKIHAGRFKHKIKGLKTLDTLKRTFPAAFLLVKRMP